MKGKVLIISVVPAVTTPVCAMQSKYLESRGEGLGKNITLLTVSRDSIEALDTFATSIGTRHAMYLSDREFGGFGEATGLKVEGADILARSVIVVDGTGIVRYMQVVPELTELPDMDKAFATARKLASESIWPGWSVKDLRHPPDKHFPLYPFKTNRFPSTSRNGADQTNLRAPYSHSRRNRSFET